jgi:hypothetical protein
MGREMLLEKAGPVTRKGLRDAQIARDLRAQVGECRRRSEVDGYPERDAL